MLHHFKNLIQIQKRSCPSMCLKKLLCVCSLSGIFVGISLLSAHSLASEVQNHTGNTPLTHIQSDKPLVDVWGISHSCDEEDPVYVAGVKENCAVCGKKRILSSGKNYCILPCPADKPLQDYLGKCHSCNEKEDVNVWSVTNNCQNTCGNKRILNGSWCILK